MYIFVARLKTAYFKAVTKQFLEYLGKNRISYYCYITPSQIISNISIDTSSAYQRHACDWQGTQ